MTAESVDDRRVGERASLAVRRGASRLAAVQALYEMEVAGVSAEAAMSEFLKRRWLVATSLEPEAAAADLVEPDPRMFVMLVEGVTARRSEIDTLLGGALSEGKSLDRIEILLRAILRTGTYELLALGEVPAKAAINEYVEIAHAFYSGLEPGLVNGILDRLARRVRAAEMDAPAHGSSHKAG